MNLHIVPDNTFINTFCDNLEELGLMHENKIVVRTNHNCLSAIKRKLPFAPLYSSQFAALVEDTAEYQKVFLHYFTPLLYRWVARHRFKELNWMVWGGDLYNLPSLDRMCYEPITFEKYIKKNWSVDKLLYDLKVWTIHAPFKKKAYRKVNFVLTWMKEEYQFALQHLSLQAEFKFFFYENKFPYGKLDDLRQKPTKRGRPSLVIGNSGSPANNHLDAVHFLEEHQVEADLLIPISYGDKRYISFLKKELKYSYGKLEFVERYMNFEEYLEFLSGADGLVMNTIRPQGYGNILMMLYMDKPVFFNKKNISLPDLNQYQINWQPLENLISYSGAELSHANKNAVMRLLSHERLLTTYQKLF